MYYSNQRAVCIEDLFMSTTFPSIKSKNENINAPSSHRLLGVYFSGYIHVHIYFHIYDNSLELFLLVIVT